MKRGAGILALLALAAAGCASSDEDLHRELVAERLESMAIVTRAELNREPPGSPARAVLRLWRSVQFRNPEDALAHVSPQPARRELRAFEDFIVAAGGDTSSTSKPQILSVKQSAGRARVRVEFIRHKKVGDQVRSIPTGQLTVELVRGRTGWLVLWQKAADQLPAAIA